MKSTVEMHQNVVVVKVRGRIDIGAGNIQLRNLLLEVAGAEIDTILLDLEGISYVDSAGLGELIYAYKALKTLGIQLHLTNVNTRVHDILTLTSLVSVFTLFDSNEDALQTLWQAA